MASIGNPNGLRVNTGGQAGTMDIQFVLIKAYNTAFTLTPTQSVPTDNYEYISNPDDGIAQILAVVQDFAEVYYIGWPEANSGGENDLTRIIIGVNPYTARGLPSTINYYPTAEGRWTDLEAALDDFTGGGSEAWFAMPGGSSGGWGWSYDN